MIRIFIALFTAVVLSTVFNQLPAAALSLKVAPLEYRTELSKGEKKKGFIDVSNPTGQTVVVRTSAEGFKQIDDNGSLTFFKSEQIQAGVKLDLKEFTLGPRQALRMYFILDGTKLPPGDVFGAIFFTTTPAKATTGVGQSVRLGTILSVVNGTPGERKADVTSLSVPFLQLDETISGTYSIKNTGDPAKASGFYPEVTVSSWPGGQPKKITGSLVFAGRERENSLRQQLGVGIHRIEVAYGDSKQASWVIAITPWMLVGLTLVLLIVSIELWLFKKRRKIVNKAAQKKATPTPDK
ncbi:MAG TPA: hypothetical protein PK096_01875 [Candidatus Saccharibacteria bacterium]|nr:hypothetical protein [Candidatus Saccharibacteria bacterium]HRK94095.1 hypothetical protein [Candidatus Saccharibacteria bacterium]